VEGWALRAFALRILLCVPADHLFHAMAAMIKKQEGAK
jgi:hypothetical protein